MLMISRKWIESQISAGYTIICDRYYYSGIVYSAAKNNPSLTLKWAKAPDIGLPRPDAIIFLDLEPEQAAQRGGYGEEKYETQEMQKNVRRLFGELGRLGEDEKEMVVVNAGGCVEEVHEDILRRLKVLLIHVARGDMGTEIGKVS